MKVKQLQVTLFLTWLCLAILGRLLPHVPNLTPMLALALLACTVFSVPVALALMVSSVLISDVFLALLLHYPLYGLWSVFTLTGYAAITLAGVCLRYRSTWLAALIGAFGSAVGFWMWTNFGVWVEGTLYPHTFSGLWSCYLLALPFLRESLLGTVGWMFIFVSIQRSLFHKMDLAWSARHG